MPLSEKWPARLVSSHVNAATALLTNVTCSTPLSHSIIHNQALASNVVADSAITPVMDRLGFGSVTFCVHV